MLVQGYSTLILRQLKLISTHLHGVLTRRDATVWSSLVAHVAFQSASAVRLFCSCPLNHDHPSKVHGNPTHAPSASGGDSMRLAVSRAGDVDKIGPTTSSSVARPLSSCGPG
jgi:hypothetical protein